ncbi:MAG: serine/threonine protein kinase [Anaerolineales bacterium]|nr:serine/threonine protein kinase [Anaerolineales bacterium]
MPETIYNDQFRLDTTLASGGFATVYRATDMLSGRVVAVKVGRLHEDPGYAKAIIEEAKILGRMSHRGVVQLINLPRPGKAPVAFARALDMPGRPYFFVMEYLGGGTLDEYLKQVKQLSLTEAAAIATEVARGLRHVHKRGYAHNDLKLENIVFRQPLVFGQPFTPVLIDFGIATRVKMQVEAGSLYIMAPEQLIQANMTKPPELYAEPDPTKVDVWGLGVLLYRMLGGRLPFEARSERSLTDRIITSRPTSLGRLANIAPEVDELILEGCLAKNPAQRLDMLQVGTYLSRLAHGATVQTLPGGWFGRQV